MTAAAVPVGPVLVTGASGMLGQALVPRMRAEGLEVLAPTHAELDLLDPASVVKWVAVHRPSTVVHLAGHVRGLAQNMGHQMDGLVLNARMGLNMLEACASTPPTRLVVAGSNAAYGFPYARLPLREDDLVAGEPHPGEYGYAWGQRVLIAGTGALAREQGISASVALLTNMFGPGDRFEGPAAHAIPALIARCVQAADDGVGEVVAWGSPDTTRDFLYVEDAAAAMVALVADGDAPPLLNVASGEERTMGDALDVIAREAGFTGRVMWDHSKPVGIPRRSVDISLMRGLDLPPPVGFDEGVRRTVASWRGCAA